MRGSNAKPLEVRLISHPPCRASPKAEDIWRIPDCAFYAIAIIVEHAATMHRVDHPNPRHDPNAWAHLLADSEADASAAGPTTPTALFPSLVPARGRRWIAREPLVRTLIANYFTATEPNELHEIVGVPPGPARCRRGERGCGPDRSGRDRGRGRALTDSRRGSVQGTTQPFAHLVNILSRPLANDCRSLLVNAAGPPVYIPLARNVSMKSRMLSR